MSAGGRPSSQSISTNSGGGAAVMDNEDMLIAIAVENVNEIQKRAKLLSSQGQKMARNVQEKTTELSKSVGAPNVNFQGILNDLNSALNDISPVNTMELAEDRSLLRKYIFASSILAVFAVGEIAGKWVGSLFLGIFISNFMSYGLILVGAPAVYAYVRWMKEYDIKSAELLLALGLGVLQGYNVRDYLSLSILPLAFVPFLQAAVIRYVASKIGKERAPVIGVVAGGWILPYLVVSLVVGLSPGAIVLFVVVGAASVATLQLALARKQQNLAIIGNASNMILLEGVIIAKTLLTFALMQTYEQAKKNSSQPIIKIQAN